MPGPRQLSWPACCLTRERYRITGCRRSFLVKHYWRRGANSAFAQGEDFWAEDHDLDLLGTPFFYSPLQGAQCGGSRIGIGRSLGKTGEQVLRI